MCSGKEKDLPTLKRRAASPPPEPKKMRLASCRVSNFNFKSGELKPKEEEGAIIVGPDGPTTSILLTEKPAEKTAGPLMAP
jgi:hypothetical protein